MRADFSFVQLDDAIERGGFDIPLLDQNRLDRTHPQLHLRKMGALIIIVIVRSHRRDTTNYRLSGQISERSTLETIGTIGTAGTTGTVARRSKRENSFRQSRMILWDLKHQS